MLCALPRTFSKKTSPTGTWGLVVSTILKVVRRLGKEINVLRRADLTEIKQTFQTIRAGHIQNPVVRKMEKK
jgi:hypothetical protein